MLKQGDKSYKKGICLHFMILRTGFTSLFSIKNKNTKRDCEYSIDNNIKSNDKSG